MSPRLRKLALFSGLLEIAVGLGIVLLAREGYGVGFIAIGLGFVVLARTRWLSREGIEL